MTLLEMIKKYEKKKADIVADCGGRPTGDMVIVNAILRDLHEIEEQQPSWVTVRDKIMKKIDTEIGYEHYESAQILAQTLTLLPG